MDSSYTDKKTTISYIEKIAARFENHILYDDIVRWLSNFDEKDKPIALSLLNYLNYYSYDRILSSLVTSLRVIRTKYSKHVRILPIRKINKYGEGTHMGGQSGQLIAYYVRKATEIVFGKKYEFAIIEEEELATCLIYPKRTYHIILVDDFSGTGDTFIDYYTYIEKRLPPHRTVDALLIGYMEKAYDRLNTICSNVYGEKICSVFANINGLRWLNTYSNEIYANLAANYGRRLFDSSKGNISWEGYKGSQALVAFEYSTPNNTLPIIWASQKNDGTGCAWFPIFPRNPGDKLDRYRHRKKQMFRWASYAFEAGLDGDIEKIYSVDTILQFMMLLMLSEKKSEAIICNTLTIGLTEYEELIQKCQNNAFLDNMREPTSQGLLFLNKLRDNIERDRHILTIEETYIPDTFMGIS